MLEISESTPAQFVCQRCGRCCTIYGQVRVEPDEGAAIAAFLQIPWDRFQQEYLVQIDQHWYLAQPAQAPCRFLVAQDCQIYPVRPRQCRTFPYWPRYLSSRANWQALAPQCPAVASHNRASYWPVQALEALGKLFAKLQSNLPVQACHVCGQCCDFPRTGEVLYATQLEVQYFLAHHGLPTQVQSQYCPGWRQQRCTTRAGRPLGCRLYYCDPDWHSAMLSLSAEYHQAIKQLHQRYDLPYNYQPFLQLLVRETPRP